MPVGRRPGQRNGSNSNEREISSSGGGSDVQDRSCSESGTASRGLALPHVILAISSLIRNLAIIFMPGYVISNNEVLMNGKYGSRVKCEVYNRIMGKL